jgi:parallel beta-helix repeat protein
MVAMGLKKFIASTILLPFSMKPKVFIVAFVLALFFSAVVTQLLVNLAEANMMSEKISPIYIRSDGNIEPSGSLLKRTGNVYTFTGSSVPSFQTMGLSGFHVHTIVIQCDNVVLDGAGYALYGPGNLWTAITIDSRKNVTVENIEVNNFQTGISVSNSSNITFSQNNIINNSNGIQLAASNYSSVFKNNLRGSYNEIWFTDSNYNSIFGNTVYWTDFAGSSASRGFFLSYSCNNTFIGNSVTGQGQGVLFESSTNNTFRLNDFINNAAQVKDASFYSSDSSKNIWDDGSTGNFWSNYTGPDINKDGIGDSPFALDGKNVDRFPVMKSIYIAPVTLPIPFDKEIDHSQQSTQTPSPTPTVTSSPKITPSPSSPQASISMPQEYINYTVSNINGSLWATVDGVYQMHISPDLVGQEIQMVYPTPPGTTRDIRLSLDGQTISWSNYTQTNPEALHYTYLGEWPMITCTILPSSTDFQLRIHYQHPIMQANGSYLFLYDLNISPYLSGSSTNSTAHFSIYLDENCSDIQVYNVPRDSSILRDRKMTSVDFTLTQENSTKLVSFIITSDNSKPVPGDELITFQNSQINIPELSSLIILAVGTIGASLVTLIVRRKRTPSNF